MKLLRFKQLENLDVYKEEFFDKVQDAMKNILRQRGIKNVEEMKTDIITQFQNKIKEIVDTLTNDGAITPEVAANQIIDKYLEKTKFNNQEETPSGNEITGDRAMNNIE